MSCDESDLRDRCVSGTSQGGGTLAAGEIEPMSVGKITKSAKKRLRKRDREAAAAKLVAQQTRQKFLAPAKTAALRKKARNPNAKAKIVSANVADAAGDATDGEEQQQPAIAAPNLTSGPKAPPMGSPAEQRKKTVTIRLRTKALAKNQEALAKAEATTERIESEMQHAVANKALQQALQSPEIQQQLMSMLQQMQGQQQQHSVSATTDEAATPSTTPAAAAAATVAQDAAGPVPDNGATTTSYRAAAQAGQTKAELQARIDALQRDLAAAHEQLEEAQLRVATSESKLTNLEGKAFMQALNKPATFTGVKVIGKPTLSVRDWILAVKDYTDGIVGPCVRQAKSSSGRILSGR